MKAEQNEGVRSMLPSVAFHGMFIGRGIKGSIANGVSQVPIAP